MKKKEKPDPRRAVFERAADRAKLTGRRREIAWLYFAGSSAKEMMRATGVPEGTLRRHLISLHGRMGSTVRTEFVHRFYDLGNGNGRRGSAHVI